MRISIGKLTNGTHNGDNWTASGVEGDELTLMSLHLPRAAAAK